MLQALRAFQDEFAEPFPLRAVFIALLVGLPAASLLVLIVGWVLMGRLRSRLPRIDGPLDMDEFKRGIRLQMRLALVALPLLLLNGLVFPTGLVLGHLGLFDLLYAIVPSLIVAGAGRFAKGREQELAELPVSDSLKRERDRVVQVWHTQPLAVF